MMGPGDVIRVTLPKACASSAVCVVSFNANLFGVFVIARDLFRIVAGLLGVSR